LKHGAGLPRILQGVQHNLYMTGLPGPTTTER
jgi:hypothetical protein